MDARVESGGEEPKAPRWIEWRLAIYPIAVGVGAVALAYQDLVLSPILLLVFIALMLMPLWIKWRAWGGVRKGLRWMFRESNLRVTSEGKLFVVLVILFGVAAINTGTNLLYLILAMMLSIMVLSTALASANLRGLRISRRLPPYVFAGEEFRMRLVLSNPRRVMPALAVEARERTGPFGPDGAAREGPPAFFFSLEPGERKAASLALRVPRRGVYPLEGFTLATRFPFGFAVQHAKGELEGEVVVFPAPRELGASAVRELGAATEVRRTRAFVSSPEEFRGLREYRPGDNPRWIHWRSSARRGALLVKEWEPHSSRRAAVVLDAEVPAPAAAAPAPAGEVRFLRSVEAEIAHRAREKARTLILDRGCTLAVSLLEHLARSGERPDFAVLHRGEVVRFPGESFAREAFSLFDTLARLQPADDPELRRLVEAAAEPVRLGARVFVLTARDPAEVRRAIERAEPRAAFAVEAISFADDAQVERMYARSGA